jgi:hypothetical protein
LRGIENKLGTGAAFICKDTVTERHPANSKLQRHTADIRRSVRMPGTRYLLLVKTARPRLLRQDAPPEMSSSV